LNYDLGWWLLALCAASIIGCSKTGLPGISMISVAIFAELLPSRQASGMVLPLLLFADLVAVKNYRQHAIWRHIWRVLPWTVLGIVLGAFALASLNDRQAKVLIGGIILALVALHGVRFWQVKRQIRPTPPAPALWFPATLGLLVGFTTLLANAAGPLMAIYLLALRLPKLAFVGTAAVFFLLINLIKVPFMAGLGLLTVDSLQLNFWLAPAVVAGAYGGRLILPHISQRWFERIALAFSALAGLRLMLA
jgi:uncharacterized protein